MVLEKIRVLIADDHEIVRAGLKMLLGQEDDIEVVGEAVNGERAVSLFEKLKPDILLIDIAMPKLNGLDAASKILSGNSKAKIMILSGYADDGYIQKSLEIGISGFIVKQAPTSTLIKAVRSIHNGLNYYCSSVNGKRTIRATLDDQWMRAPSILRMEFGFGFDRSSSAISS